MPFIIVVFEYPTVMNGRTRTDPTTVLSEDTWRRSEGAATEYTISAATAVADAVRSTLGPEGMDKMLITRHGNVLVTNDGATLLSEMNVTNPVARFVADVAATQASEVSDGTTTSVILASELLGQAQRLLERGIHPTTIARGYELATDRAVDLVDGLCVTLDPEDDDAIARVGETAMTGKSTEQHAESLLPLVVEAVRAVTVEADGNRVVDLHSLRVDSSDAGGHPSESELLEGAVLFEDPAHEAMPTTVEDAAILLLDCPLELGEPTAEPTVDVGDHDQLQRFLDRDRKRLTGLAESVIESGANVVLCGKHVDPTIQERLADEGILAVRRVPTDDLAFIREILGGEILTDIDEVDRETLADGHVGRDGDGTRFYIEGCGEGTHGATFLLRGSTRHALNEVERGVEDAIDVAARAVTTGTVVPGAGAVEVELAIGVREYATGVDGREQYAIEAFADALEVVPRTLAENAGLDPIDALVELRAAHRDGNERVGLNVRTGTVEDSIDAGVFDLPAVKKQSLTTASEVAAFVLRIDDIVSVGHPESDDRVDPDDREESDGPRGVTGGAVASAASK